MKVKLSPTQQQVLNYLMTNEGSYIHKSPYYNHNRVVSKEPFQHEYGFETHEFMQFSRPTLDVLIRIGAIEQSGVHERHYVLTKSSSPHQATATNPKLNPTL